MGSPYLSEAFQPIKWLGKACNQFRELLATNEKLAAIFGWLLNTAGELSDAVLDGIEARVTPCGAIVAYGGPDVPSDYWMSANGQAISRTTYPKLFLRYGTRYGGGDGSTTFNLPNLNARTLVHFGSTYDLGKVFGSDSVVLTFENMPLHFHGYGEKITDTNDANFTVRPWNVPANGTTEGFQLLGDGVGAGLNPLGIIGAGALGTTIAISHGEATPTNTGFDNRQLSMAINYMVKVK